MTSKKCNAHIRCEKENWVRQTGKQRKCPLCGAVFEVGKGGKEARRQFCYNCLPPENKDGRCDNGLTHSGSLYRALKQILVEYKGSKCECCGYDKSIAALDFHHKDQTDKDFAVSQLMVNARIDMQKVFQEVDKCIMVCKNCHAEIHEDLRNEQRKSKNTFEQLTLL